MQRHHRLLEARRYTAAIWRPCLALAATAAATPVTVTYLTRLDPGPSKHAATLCVIAAALVGASCAMWFAGNLRHALLQPHRDRDAAELLADLCLAARRPDCLLLEISHTQWVSGAGQRAWAVDTATGAVADHWFPQATFPPGTFVLLRRSSDQATEILAWLPPATITAAARHASRQAARHHLLAARDRRCRARQQKASGREVVHEAEQIARQARSKPPL